MAGKLEPREVKLPEVVEDGEQFASSGLRLSERNPYEIILSYRIACNFILIENSSQTESSEKTEDLLEMVKKLQKEGSLEPQIEDLINRIHELQQGKLQDLRRPAGREGHGLGNPPLHHLEGEIQRGTGRSPSSLGGPASGPGLLEWRESAPRGGFEQKARGTADPPAVLPKEGRGGTEELHVGRAHRANFYPKLSDHRDSRTEEAGVAHGRTAGGFDRPTQGPLGIPREPVSLPLLKPLLPWLQRVC
ncbi:uncharacterized protein [Ovis canadensis]|uniref:uncharacterized protein n=1 Tax=Ovis canadensis TaxID=37174 RepID=UPI00374FE4D3